MDENGVKLCKVFHERIRDRKFLVTYFCSGVHSKGLLEQTLEEGVFPQFFGMPERQELKEGTSATVGCFGSFVCVGIHLKCVSCYFKLYTNLPTACQSWIVRP